MPPKPPAPGPVEPAVVAVAAASEHPPITSLEDPRAIQIMSTEHWSLLSARSLAYNEAFTRGGMFLTFLSMSFVALALVASAMSFTDQFLGITAIVLAFDLAIGLGTFGRIIAANQDDYRALHGMARIRHGYTQVAPMLAPYFTSSVHDDVPGVLVSYGSPQTSTVGQVTYALTTSSGMIGLILALLAGVLVHVLVLLAGLDASLGFVLAAVAIVLTFLALAAFTARYFRAEQERLPVLFPTPADPAAGGTERGTVDAAG